MDRAKVVEYLRVHSELLDAPVKSVIQALKSAGLICPTTNWVDCLGIHRYIRSARGIPEPRRRRRIRLATR